MKKVLLSLALILASFGMANANTNVSESVISNEILASDGDVIGTYTGSATATVMGGFELPVPVTVSLDVEIQSNGILHCSMLNAGGSGHGFDIYTTTAVTGSGTYSITGTYTDKDGIESDVTGNIVVSVCDGTTLTFVCNAYTNSALSQFNYTGTKNK